MVMSRNEVCQGRTSGPCCGLSSGCPYYVTYPLPHSTLTSCGDIKGCPKARQEQQWVVAWKKNSRVSYYQTDGLQWRPPAVI